MKKQIVFVETLPSVFTCKIARMFKDRGYETVLISILKFNEEPYKDAYAKLIKFDFNALTVNRSNFFDISKRTAKGKILKIFSKIRKLKPSIVIGVASPRPVWPAALARFFFRKTPFIYLPYDVNIMRYTKMEYYKQVGIPNFELRAEKYCFENSNGIIFKGGESKFVSEKFKIKCPTISFPPYCSKEYIIPLNKNKLSKRDKQIHLVYIGNIENEKEDSAGLGLGTWEFPISKLLEQKIHFHLYIWQHESIKNSKVYGKFLKSKYFHLHKPLGPKEIINEISKYDFGCWFPNFNFKVSRKEFINLASGNKMASFLEAGIPFFYISQLQFVDTLMKKYGLSLTVDISNPKGFDNLKKRIRELNYKKLEKNILKARKDFSMEKQFPRLENFIKTVMKSK